MLSCKWTYYKGWIGLWIMEQCYCTVTCNLGPIEVLGRTKYFTCIISYVPPGNKPCAMSNVLLSSVLFINKNFLWSCLFFLHSSIKAVPMGMSRSTKKLLQSKVPNLGRYQDVSDFFLKWVYSAPLFLCFLSLSSSRSLSTALHSLCPDAEWSSQSRKLSGF